MNHRSRMIPFMIVALVAMIILVPRSSAGFGVGIGLALLLCPLVMGSMMWLMMRQNDAPADHTEHVQSKPTDDHPSRPGALHR